MVNVIHQPGMRQNYGEGVSAQLRGDFNSRQLLSCTLGGYEWMGGHGASSSQSGEKLSLVMGSVRLLADTGGFCRQRCWQILRSGAFRARLLFQPRATESWHFLRHWGKLRALQSSLAKYMYWLAG